MSLGDRRPGAVGGWLLGKVLWRGALAAGGREIQTGRGWRRTDGLGRGCTLGFLSIASPVPPKAGLPEKGFLPFPPQVTLEKAKQRKQKPARGAGLLGRLSSLLRQLPARQGDPCTPGRLRGGLLPLCGRGGPSQPRPVCLCACPRHACRQTHLLLPSSGPPGEAVPSVVPACSLPSLRGPGREAQPGAWHPGACGAHGAWPGGRPEGGPWEDHRPLPSP